MYTHERPQPKSKLIAIPPPPFFPEYNSLMNAYLTTRELSYPIAISNGWYPTSDSNIPRIVIPCTNSKNSCYYQARAMIDSNLRYKSPNTSREDSIVWLWGQPGDNRCVITEGPMDALAAAEICGYAIAVMGSKPPSEVFIFIKNLLNLIGCCELIIVPDLDNLEFGALIMSQLAVDIPVKIVLPLAKDLAATKRKDRKV